MDNNLISHNTSIDDQLQINKDQIAACQKATDLMAPVQIQNFDHVFGLKNMLTLEIII